jgi:hypothetical protein
MTTSSLLSDIEKKPSLATCRSSPSHLQVPGSESSQEQYHTIYTYVGVAFWCAALQRRGIQETLNVGRRAATFSFAIHQIKSLKDIF